MGDFRIEGTAGLEKLAIAYREGDRKIRSAMAKGLRTPATPLAKQVVEKGAQDMPHGGGLSDRLAQAKGSVSLSLLGKTVAVAIRARDAEGDLMRRIDREGMVRHPVYGNRGAWAVTNVQKGTYTKAFQDGAPEVQVALYIAIQAAAVEIAAAASEG